nr:MAG TPA: Phosphatidylglycerophosphatase A [Caudoviricetes sp.]
MSSLLKSDDTVFLFVLFRLFDILILLLAILIQNNIKN